MAGPYSFCGLKKGNPCNEQKSNLVETDVMRILRMGGGRKNKEPNSLSLASL